MQEAPFILPNFFIIGAPKCGTSTLHLWLGRHSKVFMAEDKEPAYYTSFRDSTWNGPAAEPFASALVASAEEYARLFEPAGDSVIVGESSTDYLWRPETPTRIRSDIGDRARLVCVLRDPVRRAFSEHMYLVRDGREDRSFLDSLELEDERYRAGWIPLFYHRRRGAYAAGLQRYFELFGRDAVKVLIFEECFRDPEATIRKLTAFLGIPYEPCASDYRTNVSGVPRSRLLHGLGHTAFSRRNPARAAWRALVPPSVRSRIKAMIDEMNLRKVVITADERRHAEAVFTDEIAATEELLGRSIDGWTQASRA